LSATVANDDEVGDWAYLRREISRRTLQPWSQAPFVIYVLVAIVTLGGLGIWVEIVKILSAEQSASYDGLLTAMATFYPALVGSASLQLLLVATGNSDRILTAFATLVWVISIGSVILLSVFHDQYPRACFSAAIGFVFFSIWLWWITNGDDPTYKQVSVDTATGGSTSRELKGDISGFRAD